MTKVYIDYYKSPHRREKCVKLMVLKGIYKMRRKNDEENRRCRSDDKKIPKETIQTKKYMSKNYQKTLKKYHKWLNRKNNKTQNAYHQFSKYLVKKI